MRVTPGAMVVVLLDLPEVGQLGGVAAVGAVPDVDRGDARRPTPANT
jgi:hypothetical protein